jgi:hypothetical protein
MSDVKIKVQVPDPEINHGISWNAKFRQLNPNCPEWIMEEVHNDLKQGIIKEREYTEKQRQEELEAQKDALQRKTNEQQKIFNVTQSQRDNIRAQIEVHKPDVDEHTLAAYNILQGSLADLGRDGYLGAGTRKNKKRSRRHKKRRGKKTRRHRSKRYKR